DDAQTDAVLVEFAGFPTQGRQEQLHQRAHLVGGPLPVLAGEGEQCKDFDTGLGTHLDHGPNRIDTGLVSSHARQETPLCPAVVAIHDDCHMAGYVPPGHLPALFHLTTLPALTHAANNWKSRRTTSEVLRNLLPCGPVP